MKLFMRIVAFLGVFLCTSIPLAAHAAILINEIAWMGTDQDPNGSYCEWIELLNTGASAVSLTDWVLSWGSVLISMDSSVSILGNGYLVVERYTENACPDPVSSVSDVSASFGNGLPNSGATLVLKRADGSIEDQIAGGTDWGNVGGDNVTKATAQRGSSGFLTAEATPGAQNASQPSENPTPVNDTDEEDAEAQKASTGSNSDIPPSPVKTLRITAPKIAYVNQPVVFLVTPGGSGDRLVRYRWNFGDGETVGGRDPVHTFTHPGMYVVVAQSRFLGEEALARTEITVLPATLSLARTDAGDIQIHNNAKYEIDLGKFVLYGTTDFVIPDKTILLPSATLTARRGLIEVGPRGNIRLEDPMGVIIASMLSFEVSSEPEVKEEAAFFIEEATTEIDSLEPEALSLSFETDIDEVVENTFPNPEEPMVYRPGALTASVADGEGESNAMLVYVGLMIVLVLGILGVYARKS